MGDGDGCDGQLVRPYHKAQWVLLWIKGKKFIINNKYKIVFIEIYLFE